jgi:membrane-bound lytic murein transglycosylase D
MGASRIWAVGVALILATAARAATPPAKPEENSLSVDDVLEAGKNLFDELAPDEVKAQFEFPDKARWDATVRQLQAALDGTDPKALLQFEPEVRSVLSMLRDLPGGDEYADWLAERLDYIEAAKQLPSTPTKPPTVKPSTQYIPQYDIWVKRTQQRTRPAAANTLVPRLKPVFVTGQVPGDLVWLAEVESSFNPNARSPVGARGLFQLMPETAKELGLSTMLPDERTNPEKSAAASAAYLRKLHERFGDWPLAIAAYNAGGGRVSRALEKQRAKTFAEIAPTLSVETQMYVPKVLATLQVRSGTVLAGPGPR